VAKGLENKEIGHRIGLTEQAVKEHVSALLRRFAVRNRAALAEIATELKIAGTMGLPPEWLGFIYEKSPVASAVVEGPEHVYVAANDAYRRAAGTDDIVGRRIVDVFPTVSAGSLAGLAEVVATRTTKVIHEHPGRWVRGGELTDGFVDVVWQPLPGNDGGIIISGVDVTEQVRARQSIDEFSAERLTLLDLVPSGIVVLDARGAVLKVNRAAQAFVGAGHDLPAIDDTLSRALRGEPVHDLRLRMFVPALGRVASLRIDAERLVAAAGVVHGVIAAITEVTQDTLTP
jgi:PAS domain-containing protein